jgi:hypothetical protein
MLCQFQFKNFSSYRDETVFDMQATDIEEFRDSLIPPPGDNFSSLLPVSVVFGPNSGGKSNAINALACLISRIIIPIMTSIDYHNPFGMYLKKYEPFLLDEVSKNTPTEFEVFFRTVNGQYQYQLSLLEDTIITESLSYVKTPCKRRRATLLFDRENGKIELGTALKRANTQNISPTIPYISFLSINYAFPEIQDVIDWFGRCCIINYGISDRDHRFYTILNDPEIKPMLLGILSDLDIPISDYDILEEADGGNEKKLKFTTTHIVHERPYLLDINNESEGTAKLLSILPGVITSLASGGLLLVDELDAKLHPHLLRYLIQLYTNSAINTHHAQLIFTCHDISIMKNDLLRRDEIWFAAQNDEGASELWSLYDIQDINGNRIKNTAAYDRQYLAGRYGADPYLKKMMNWGGADA